MKRVLKNKLYLGIGLVIALFLCMSALSMSSIHLLAGNARVVNFVGIVRGATQKLVKEELMGHPDDALVQRLSGIVDELLTGEGQNGLVVLPDEAYLGNMRQVKQRWGELQLLIDAVRQSENGKTALFDASQDYFELVNDTVFSAEAYSEGQVNRINALMLVINIVFIVLIGVGAILAVRTTGIRRRAEALGKIAYVDPLTGIDNRASCERLIERMKKENPAQDVLVFMFDMNDLKLTNDFLGHQGGDRVIASFARILRDAAQPYGFLGRYGGDEFLAVFENATDLMARQFQNAVRQQVDAYNELRTNKLEQISYAAGYAIGNLGARDLDDVIHDADNQMYADKRRIKKLG